MELVRAHVYVYGRVQGVFFRFETAKKARANNVNGWVRNLPDGRVEAVFQGPRENVMRLIEFCHRGPPYAKVTRVEVKWEEASMDFKGFTVRY